MLILLNGEPREVAAEVVLSDLIATLDLSNGRFAVEVNETLVPRSVHTRHILRENDRVEIVQAIGGG